MRIFGISNMTKKLLKATTSSIHMLTPNKDVYTDSFNQPAFFRPRPRSQSENQFADGRSRDGYVNYQDHLEIPPMSKISPETEPRLLHNDFVTHSMKNFHDIVPSLNASQKLYLQKFFNNMG